MEKTERPCVCISGSTQGIGRGIADAFARAGARLVINSNVADDTALRELSAITECHFVAANLGEVEGARHFVREAHAHLGRLDTLVNNAGSFYDTAFPELDQKRFDDTFNLNVRGYLFAAQAFAELVAPGQANTSIVCIGSTNSLAAEKDSVIYDASKGAVLMLIRSLAVTLAPRGIRVNGIGPGIVETPLTAASLKAPGAADALRAQIPLNRLGQPVDIGGAAVFLASPEASYITGQMLYIDGGILANQMTWEVRS